MGAGRRDQRHLRPRPGAAAEGESVGGVGGAGRGRVLDSCVNLDRPVRVRGRANGESGSCAGNRDVHGHGHDRQAAPRTSTQRPGAPRPLPAAHAGATVIVDEAGMVGTPTLHQLAGLADRNGWRVALSGGPRQPHAVGRGRLFAELCATGRVHDVATIHRFTAPWEAAASPPTATRRSRRVRHLRNPRPGSGEGSTSWGEVCL